ncbi:uncharacterized protein LOC128239216 isoform X2 [Mya arenaria]|uniref:uncharacterized protein LOC128239216 isoform X2 n=1 Tax=Mya arenaria TaxID=6604 RepID=UPI0022E12B9C|nr:uncharacterized protein LOC128239216 isoform X2 [Mya arenaria]
MIMLGIQGVRAWTMSSSFNATGSDNGLYVEYAFAETPPSQVHCSFDMNNDEVYFMNVTTETFKFIDIHYDTFGYYDLALICGEDSFEIAHELDKYIGTEISGVDISNKTRDIFIGVTDAEILDGKDIYFNVEFEAGLDVTINVTVNGHTQNKTVAANGSHIFILDAAWFSNGLYTVEVSLDNPISTVIQTNAIIAVQTGIEILASSLVEYLAPPYAVSADRRFNVALDFKQGENVSIVCMIIDSEQHTQQLEAEILTGQVTGTHNFMFLTSLIGNYSLEVEVSNYVSSYQSTFNLEIKSKIISVALNVSERVGMIII